MSLELEEVPENPKVRGWVVLYGWRLEAGLWRKSIAMLAVR